MLGMSTGKRPALLGFAGLLAMIALRPAIAGAQQAIVTGKVTAQVGGQPLSDARVFVVGSTLAATTNAEGQYTLRGVPVGSIEIRMIRVGYHEQKKPLVVTAGASTTLDFAMKWRSFNCRRSSRRRRASNAASKSATRSRRRRRLEARRRIADHEHRDLLVAKAPGVVVLPGAMTGTAGTVRIRGVSSLSLSNAPIWVVDGVRFNARTVCRSRRRRHADQLYESQRPESRRHRGHRDREGPVGRDAVRNGCVERRHRRHDEEGTRRAARAGTGSAKADASRINAHYPDTYAIWGHRPAAPTTQVRCLLRELPGKTCIQDSVTSLNIVDVSRPHAGAHRQSQSVRRAGERRNRADSLLRQRRLSERNRTDSLARTPRSRVSIR